MFTQTAEGGIRNGYTLRFSNKLADPEDFTLEVSGIPGIALSSVVAKPLPDGRLGVRLDPDSTLEVPRLCDDGAGCEPHGVVDADHLHRGRPENGRAQCRGRPFLRAVIGRRENMEGIEGRGGGRISAPSRGERHLVSEQFTGRHVLAWLGGFFLVMFAANGALIYFALHTLHGERDWRTPTTPARRSTSASPRRGRRTTRLESRTS